MLDSCRRLVSALVAGTAAVGATLAAIDLRVDGATLTGTLIAASGDLYVERKLSLKKE